MAWWRSLGNRTPIRDVVAPVPKGFASALVNPMRLRTQLRSGDYLEIEGKDQVAGVSADWSERILKADGVLCDFAPICFDSTNSAGAVQWGPNARDCIVVAVRGDVSFEVMAHRAEEACAVALVVVDNEDIFEDDWEMTADAVDMPPPGIPAILVPKDLREHLCSGNPDVRARIFRNVPSIPTEDYAAMLQWARMYGMEGSLPDALSPSSSENSG